MSTQTFHLPDVGEGLTEAEIVQWRVAPGDTVAVNDVLVEIETAKSLVELPSPFAGTVGELLAAEGDTVTVGAPVITIAGETGGQDAAAGLSAHGEPAAEPESDPAGAVLVVLLAAAVIWRPVPGHSAGPSDPALNAVALER